MKVHKCTRCGDRRPCAAPHQEGIWVCDDCMYLEELYDGKHPCVARNLVADAIVAAQQEAAS